MHVKRVAIAFLGSMAMTGPALAQAEREGAAFGGVWVATAGQDAAIDPDRRLRLDRTLDTRFGHAATLAGTPRLCGHGLSCTDGPRGGAYAGRIGMDVQAGRLVVGAVSETGRGANGAVRRNAPTMPRNVAETATRARVGYTPDAGTLIYGTAGPGRARFDRDAPALGGDGRPDRDDNRNLWGIQSGAGVERKLGEHLSLGVEYLYRRYAGTLSRLGALTVGTATSEHRRFRWHSLRATAAYRF